MTKKKNLNFKDKIWKSLFVLGLVFSGLNFLGTKLQISAKIFIVVSALTLPFIWHAIDKWKEAVKFFKDMRKDINYIKNKVASGGKKK